MSGPQPTPHDVYVSTTENSQEAADSQPNIDLGNHEPSTDPTQIGRRLSKQRWFSSIPSEAMLDADGHPTNTLYAVAKVPIIRGSKIQTGPLTRDAETTPSAARKSSQDLRDRADDIP